MPDQPIPGKELCPYCDQTPEVVGFTKHDYDCWACECTECDLRGPSHSLKGDAIAEWNDTVRAIRDGTREPDPNVRLVFRRPQGSKERAQYGDLYTVDFFIPIGPDLNLGELIGAEHLGERDDHPHERE